MTCKDIQITYSDTPEADLPADVKSHLSACAGCRTYFQQCRDLRSLMAFKRHECPSPETAGRIAFKVHTRLEGMASARPDPAAGGWRIGLRYAALAALAVVVMVNLHQIFQAPPKGAAVAEWRSAPDQESPVNAPPLFAEHSEFTPVFFDDPMGFGFSPSSTPTNFLPVRQPARSGQGNFQFIDYRP